MLTTKNQAGSRLWLVPALILLLAGCTPAGPRALLEGKKMLDRGHYSEAIEQLNTATTILSTNAQAWNYLGVAYHHTRQLAEAERAYQRALKLNPDLSEVRYNLGCLWLDQNKLEAAKTELTTFTLRRSNVPDGFLKLGAAQLRSRELGAAEKTFGEALRLSPEHPEALVGLGVVRLQRGRTADAVQLFDAALKQQPGYRPALLNLAVVAHEHLKDPSLARQRYQDYLGAGPPPENAEEIKLIVRQLDQQLHPTPAPPPPTAANLRQPSPPPPSSPSTNLGRLATRPARTEAASNLLASLPAPKPEPAPPRVAAAPKTEPRVTPPRPTPPPSGPPGATQIAAARSVRLPPEPAIKQPQEAPLPSSESGSASPPADGSKPTAPPLGKAPSRPVSGDRPEAERAFAQGVQAQGAHRLPEAIQAYRRATQVDPTYFDAYYNLGLAATEAGNLQTALAAYEQALVIRPQSLDARYNFALALKQAKEPQAAARQLEKVLSDYPNESRAHLALGNLYAQQLQQPDKARHHYTRVLETDPRNPQAGAIRYWLADHPR